MTVAFCYDVLTFFQENFKVKWFLANEVYVVIVDESNKLYKSLFTVPRDIFIKDCRRSE